MYPSHHHVDNISTDLETLPSHITCLQLSASLPEGFLQQHRRFLYLWAGPPKSTRDLTLNQGAKMSVDRNSTQVFNPSLHGTLLRGTPHGSFMDPNGINLTVPNRNSLTNMPFWSFFHFSTSFFPIFSFVYPRTINNSQINSCGQVLILKSF